MLARKIFHCERRAQEYNNAIQHLQTKRTKLVNNPPQLKAWQSGDSLASQLHSIATKINEYQRLISSIDLKLRALKKENVDG